MFKNNYLTERGGGVVDLSNFRNECFVKGERNCTLTQYSNR